MVLVEFLIVVSLSFTNGDFAKETVSFEFCWWDCLETLWSHNSPALIPDSFHLKMEVAEGVAAQLVFYLAVKVHLLCI